MNKINNQHAWRYTVHNLNRISKRLHAEADQEFERLKATGTDGPARAPRRDRGVPYLKRLK